MKNIKILQKSSTFFICILTLICMIGFYSCDKDSLEVQEVNEKSLDSEQNIDDIVSQFGYGHNVKINLQGISVKKGRLHFATAKDYLSNVMELATMTEDELYEFYQKVGFNNSFAKKYYKALDNINKTTTEASFKSALAKEKKLTKIIMDKDGERTLVPIIGDKLTYIPIVNLKGEFSVGNSIFKITDEIEIQVDRKLEYLLDNINNENYDQLKGKEGIFVVRTNDNDSHSKGVESLSRSNSSTCPEIRELAVLERHGKRRLWVYYSNFSGNNWWHDYSTQYTHYVPVIQISLRPQKLNWLRTWVNYRDDLSFWNARFDSDNCLGDRLNLTENWSGSKPNTHILYDYKNLIWPQQWASFYHPNFDASEIQNDLDPYQGRFRSASIRASSGQMYPIASLDYVF